MENHSSSQRWNGQGRDALTLALNACDSWRAGPEITRMEEVVLHPTYSSPWQTLHQNWVAQGFRPRGHENKRYYPHFTFAIWWHGRGKKCLPSLHPLLPTEAVRTGPGVRRVGKLACPSLAAAHRKTGIMPEQHTSSTLLKGA